MKPQFEISKNVIILTLIAFILAMATYIIPKVMMRENEDKASYDEIMAVTSSLIMANNSLREAVYYLQDENENLVAEKDSVQKQNSQLKKKVDFYFEFYRKNLPMDITIQPDSINHL